MRRLFLIAVLVAAVMALTGLGYANSGQTRVIDQSAPVTDGVNVSVDLVSIAPEQHSVTALATIFPAGSYRDNEHDSFARNLRVTSRVLKESAVFDIQEGQPVGGSYEITIPVEGNAQRYPLDHYDYSYPDPGRPGEYIPAPLLSVDEVFDDGQVRQVPVGVAAGDPPDGIVGWSEQWRLGSDGRMFKVQLNMQRSAAVISAVIVLLILVLAMAALSASVAWAVATKRRPVEPTFAGWFAGMLFALIPLQNNLPGAPSVGGTWLDVCVFLWVEVVLLAGLGVFMISWFRFREPPDYSHLRRDEERRAEEQRAEDPQEEEQRQEA